MNFGLVVLIILIAGFLGRKRPFRSSLLGCILTLSFYFVFQKFEIRSFITDALIGFAASFGASYQSYFFSSGFKGGNHNTGPSYMGGGRGSGFEGGIIMSDEERDKQKRS